MKKTTESILKYTAGEMTLEEVNKILKEEGAGYHLNPGRNEIAPGEEQNFGLLDTGTSTLDKVRVENMELVYEDMGGMKAFCYYMGELYEVQGKKLVEPDAGAVAEPVQRVPDMSRRTDLAGQTVKQGNYAVSYDALGYATRAIRED